MKNRTAIYLRLSRDDGNDESQSIQSQRGILMSYVEKQGLNFVGEYVDDGYSGTNFDRPDFNRLIDDIEKSKIDVLITKDLSRLGRNYIQVGLYTEEFFPLHNVRYIALTDNYDSDKEDENDFAPFRNIINEWYAKDTSKKIRSVLNSKAAKGEPRNTVFPIFGYAYNDAFERVPDSETAPIVQLIFKKFIEFGSTGEVAKYLFENKIKTPKYYNAIKHNYNKAKVLARDEVSFYTWSHSSVHDILSKEEYLGVYKTAKSKLLNYKNKKRLRNNECHVFENRYEPLIDRETWETASRMLKRSNGTSVPIKDNVFRGLIYCADCGKPMRLERRSKDNGENYNYRYYCNEDSCTFTNSISKTMLENVIYKEFCELREYILSKEDIFIEFAINYRPKGRDVEADIERDLALLIERNETIDLYIQKLFENNTKAVIPATVFNTMLAKYKKEKEALEGQIYDLQEKQKSGEIKLEKEEKAKKILSELKEIDREKLFEPCIIHRLIRKIVVKTRAINNSHKNKEVEIKIVYYSKDDFINGFLGYEK